MTRISIVLGLLIVFFLTSVPAPTHAWLFGKSKSDTSAKSDSSKTAGKTYINRNSTFDPTNKDAYGKTNVQRMQKGLAPIGKDGKPVQIHHFQQKNEGKRVEMQATEHQKVRHDRLKPSEIDRKDFARERKQHWKDRAKDFK